MFKNAITTDKNHILALTHHDRGKKDRIGLTAGRVFSMVAKLSSLSMRQNSINKLPALLLL